LALATFKKGVHPHEFKELTEKKAVEIMPLPAEVFVPLQQHIGVPCEAQVEKGQEVNTGQVIGASDKFISSPIHSPLTGTVKAIDKFQHPLGMRVTMIHITRSEEENWETMPKVTNWQEEPVDALRKVIRNAGIVGLGGAAFPTHVKLAPPTDKKIDSFILNGCECEPFLTADHRAMLEFSDKVMAGMAIISKILGVKNAYVAIENNKPDAITSIQKLCTEKYPDVKVVPLQVKYPQGAEKMLIDAILKRRVPAGGLPMDVGVVVNNVGTAIAIAEAVLEGKPLIQRIVTVTGDGIKEAKNVMVRIGTSFKQVLDFCGGIHENTSQIFMGGPMMGFSQSNLNVPCVKATSGIVCITDRKKIQTKTYPCIKCGNCVTACPMNLLPTTLTHLIEAQKYEESKSLGVLNCIECGSCSFSCPSRIPLVQWLRVGKLRVTEMMRKNG
jgi:electron transport complex protein RnfC